MKRISYLKLFFLLLLCGAAFAAYDRYGSGNAQAVAQGVTATVEIGDVEDIVTAQGTLEPKEYVDVGAQVSGQLEALHVDVGDNVKAGDLIAEIDAEVFESQVEGDEARLKTMQAQKLQTQAEIRQARQKRDRNHQLVEADAISREVYEDSQTTLDIAEARLMALEAQIEEAQSTLEGNRANLNYTRIYAPMDGTVVLLSAKEGETLNANQTTPTIVQIANLDTMTVRAQVAEADINKITADMPVYFTTLGSMTRRWQGHVRQVLPTPEILNDVVLYNVLVDVDNTDRNLMSGMTTQMFFVLDDARNVPVIPVSALARRAKEDAGNSYIVAVKQGQRVVEKTVTVGLSDRTHAQVISGLEAGDEIILPGPQSQDETSGPRRRTPRL